MSSALSFVREKKTFEEEEEEEERKISLADSSVCFQKHPTNEGKKRRKKKEGKKRKEKKRNEHTTGTEHSAFGLSRSLSFSFSLS